MVKACAILLVAGCAGDPDPGETSSAPVAPVASVALAPPTGIRDLVAVATASDADGAPVELAWSWTVDGKGTSYATDHVPANAIWPGQEWTVQVVPTAGGKTGAAATASAVIPEPVGGNFLVVVFDDLGVDKFNASGIASKRETTPVIDGLAAQGVYFRNAYTSPLCSPTRGEILTGRHARRTGVGKLISEKSGDELPLAALTLPEAMASARGGPYTTIAVGKYHLASLESDEGPLAPNAQGFSWYSGSNDNLPFEDDGYFNWTKVTNGVVAKTTKYATTDTVDDALAQIAAAQGPWIVYLAFNAPHVPYHVPPADLITLPVTADSPVPDLFSAMLEAADTELGRLLKGIGDDALTNTTVLLMGDNGTAKEAVLPPFDASEAKFSVNEGGVHVPLVVAGPAVTAPGSTSDALVHLVDVYATVADLAGVPLATWENGMAVELDDTSTRVLDGWSLAPYLADPTAPSARSTVYAESFSPNGPPPYIVDDEQTLRDDRYKLIRLARPNDSYTNEQFYDLTTSPYDEGEDLLLTGLTAEQADAYEQLSAELDAQLAALPYEGF